MVFNQLRGQFGPVRLLSTTTELGCNILRFSFPIKKNGNIGIFIKKKTDFSIKVFIFSWGKVKPLMT
jgi:hypothetical protein